MTRICALAWLLLVGAEAAAADELSPPQVCNDEYGSCKEECTLNWGTSFRTREKLGRCITQCGTTHDTCLERYLEVRHNELQPRQESTGASDRQGPRTRYPTEAPAPEVIPSAENDPAPATRTATRGSELPPPVDKVPEAYPGGPQEKKSSPPGQAPAARKDPPPSAKPAERPAEKPPAEKPKKDLSEWDPGDVK